MAEHGGRGGGNDSAEKAREEFFSEAQELVDGLSRDLIALEELAKGGRHDPELVNDIFRAVHTLKGLSGLFGAALMTGLAHELENVLDDLRLGRVELKPAVLDLLFRALELFGRILAAERGDLAEPTTDVKALLLALGQLAQERAGPAASPVAQYELDPGLLGVLTEYEEHRLRSNIQAGVSLFRIKVNFQLATIDSALDDLKARARPHGEIITYLPTGSGGDVDSIELEILLASQSDIDTLRSHLAGPNVKIEEVKRRGSRTAPPPGSSVMPPAMALTPAPAILWTAEGATAPSVAPPPGRHPSADDAPPPPEHASIAPAAEAAAAREMSLRSVSQTVRVDIRKLDRLMNIVGELAIVRNSMQRLAERERGGRSTSRELAAELHRLNRAFERNLSQMQAGILEVRMVPLGQAFDKLARIVRQVSREHDKQVRLVVTGAETEIDKLIVEELSDPLMHMIRNAIDHGIEERDERMRVGKPPVGTIALNAFQKGNHVVLEVEDDGGGMNPETLLASAMRRGLVTRDQAHELTPREILGLVFLPGFTTKEEATDTSGRGVGMDIVKTNINKLGGVIDIASDVGIGTKMTIMLPITLAIISVLMVEVAGRTYAVPLSSIEEALQFDPRGVRMVEGREVMDQRGRTLPVCRLSKLFGHEHPGGVAPDKTFVVVAQVADRRLGFVVDRLIGQQDIVIKALGKSLASTRGFAGATELGDQRVALVLDVASLLEEVLRSEKERFALEGSTEGRRHDVGARS